MGLKSFLLTLAMLVALPVMADSPALSWLWGDDYHIRDPRTVPAAKGTLYSFSEAVEERNYLIWIGFTGETPVATGETLGFGVDAAMFALGALEGGQAFVDLGERNIDAGKGDSHDFILPHIDQPHDYAKWLPIPGSRERIFLVSTGSDGGGQATWLIDANGATSGILIDIAGRASDGRYLDKLLPAQ